METGKVIRILKEVPQPIPVEIPTRKQPDSPTTGGDGEPIPVGDWPVRKEEEVETPA